MKNLQFRRDVIRRVMEEPGFARVLWQACAEDIFFYINTFVWTYDPRSKPHTKVPFITYPFQDRGLDLLLDSVEHEYDVVVEKSRDMGASWVCLTAIEWMWHFRSLQTFLLASRTDDYVDKLGDPKSLFWKIDFIHNNLPPWMMPPGFDSSLHRKRGNLVNPANGSVAVGEATTEDLGRGGRFTIAMCDEFAACDCGLGILRSLRDATNTRWFNSTPQGTGNAHYRMVVKSRTNPDEVRPMRFHWPDHPRKRPGLYTSHEGKLELLDKEYRHDLNYKFILDGKLRSPWYDTQCARAATPQEIAQELDIDYLGSGYNFFDVSDIESYIATYCCNPQRKGDLLFDPDTMEPMDFGSSQRGFLSLWCLLNAHDEPPQDRSYVVAVDASAGTGASNSAIAVWDEKTREKVASYVNPFIRPEALAKVAVALCKWFGGALLIWETNGSGRQFGDAVLEIGYGNVFCPTPPGQDTGKRSKKPGWNPTRDNKYALLGYYRQGLHDRDLINRCEQSVGETREYQFMGNNQVEHSAVADNEDPSGAREQHGDRVISDALAVWAMKDRPKPTAKVVTEPPIMSLAHRRKMWKAEREASKGAFVW